MPALDLGHSAFRSTGGSARAHGGGKLPTSSYFPAQKACVSEGSTRISGPSIRGMTKPAGLFPAGRRHLSELSAGGDYSADEGGTGAQIGGGTPSHVGRRHRLPLAQST